MAGRIRARRRFRCFPELPNAAYAAFTPPVRTSPPAPPAIVESNVPESTSLAARLAQGGLGFTRLVVVQRRSVDPTHVYTYHVEGQTRVVVCTWSIWLAKHLV